MNAFAAGYAGWFTDEIKFRIGSGKTRAEAKGKSIRASMRGAVGGKKGGQLWRVAQGSRSAFFKKIRNAGTHHSSQIAGQLAYINGKTKEIFGNVTVIEGGLKVLDKEAVAELVDQWSEGWQNETGYTKNGYTSHMVVSFPDDVTDSKAAAITKQWCHDIFESRTFVDDVWEYYAALHTDTANPHVHIVINNRGVDEGKWFYLAKDHDLNNELLKEMLVDIAEEHGVFLDTSTRLERGKLTYAPPKIEFQQAKRLGIEPKERPMPPAALESGKEVMRQYAAQAEAMAAISGVMKMQNLHDALVAAAVNLRDGKPVDVSTFLKEEELVNLDLTQHPVEIRQAIVKWSADNADRIAKSEPVNRDRFVKHWFAALDAIDKSMDPDTPITFGDLTGVPPTEAIYSGTFVSAAIGDEERLMKNAETFLDTDAEIQEMRSFVASGKFTQFIVNAEFEPEDQHMIDVVGSAYNELTNEAAAEPSLALQEATWRAKQIGLNPTAFAQRVVNGAYDGRMEHEWMVDDLRQVITHHGLDGTSQVDTDKATEIVRKVYDFVADSIEKLHSNHIALEPVRQSVIIDVEKDHTDFVERSRGTMNMIRKFKTAVFDSKADEVAFLEDFKQEFGDEGLKRLAKGDLDVIKDLAVKEQERRDIAYAVFRLYKRNPDVGVDAKDASAAMDAFNPEIWHGQGGHSI